MTEYDDVKGHIFDPPCDGFPYVSIVVCPGHEPTLRYHDGRDEAEEIMNKSIMLLRRMITREKSE